MSNHDRVLCVDLDGTLLRTDMLFETLCAFMRESPTNVLLVPWWLLLGRARLKRELAERVKFDPALLPYREHFLTFLREEHAQGRKLSLASASDEKIVEAIANHLGIFHEFVASNGSINLKGEQKRKFLEERYGVGGFDYAGDARSDISVWKAAKESILVSDDAGFAARTKSKINFSKIFEGRNGGLSGIFRALRLHQWVKNLLVFVPLVMAHRLQDLEALFTTALGFVSFSLLASSVYIINDLFDLESDRQHATKRLRPFASGELSISFGMAMVPVLMALSFLISYNLPPLFLITLSIYFILTLGYSLRIKRIPIFDIVLLASLYTIRLLAGGVATNIVVSPWLLAFSMFFFFSLACVKRYSELFQLRKRSEVNARGRGYVASDLEQVISFGAASGYIAVLVLALYVHSDDVKALYSRPQLLWLVCPLLLYWISRTWLLAGRGELHEDPIVFAITDKVSYVVGILALVVIFFAA